MRLEFSLEWPQTGAHQETSRSRQCTGAFVRGKSVPNEPYSVRCRATKDPIKGGAVTTPSTVDLQAPVCLSLDTPPYCL